MTNVVSDNSTHLKMNGNHNEANTLDTKKSRISNSTVVNVDVAIKRVRFCLDNLGLNKNFNEACVAVASFKKAGTPLDQLDALTQLLITECTALYKQELQSDKDKAQLEAFNTLDAYDRADTALKSSKYRISPRAIAAVATVVDFMVHDIGLFVLRQTIKTSYTKMVYNHLLKSPELEALVSYSLFGSLSVYKAFLENPTSFDKSPKDNAGKVDANDSNDVDDDNDASDSVLEDKSPIRMQQFGYYIKKIVYQHIALKERPNKKTGEPKMIPVNNLSVPLKLLISELLRDFISTRMTNYLRVLLQVKNAKTVNDKQVLAALELMLLDSEYTVESQQLLLRVSNNVDRLKSYDMACAENKELKKEGSELVDLSQFLQRDMSDTVVVSNVATNTSATGVDVSTPVADVSTIVAVSNTSVVESVDTTVTPTGNAVPNTPVKKSKHQPKTPSNVVPMSDAQLTNVPVKLHKLKKQSTKSAVVDDVLVTATGNGSAVNTTDESFKNDSVTMVVKLNKHRPKKLTAEEVQVDTKSIKKHKSTSETNGHVRKSKVVAV